jgi:hypothetical protein
MKTRAFLIDLGMENAFMSILVCIGSIWLLEKEYISKVNLF